MERSLDRVQFDSASWFAQSRRNAAVEAAQRRRPRALLLAIAPQVAPDPDSESVALVRALVLDVAYQLK